MHRINTASEKRRPGILLSTAILALSFNCGCRTPQLVSAAAGIGPDPVELFRRARFAELAVADDVKTIVWARRLHRARMHEGEALAELMVRDAYLMGDGESAAAALLGLSEGNPLRLLLAELLEAVDRSEELRTSRIATDQIELQLDPRALEFGFPVVVAQIKGRRFKMLWDTGATENVLRPGSVEELDLVESRIRYRVMRDAAGYVMRFAATGTRKFKLGPWSVHNTPWLITEFASIPDMFGDSEDKIDGILSPQLILRGGCFIIDRARARLVVGFGKARCKQMSSRVPVRTAMFCLDGEVYASAKVHRSPDVAVQLETGSPVTFLRADATRYLPEGMIGRALGDEEDQIAHALSDRIVFRVADRTRYVDAIDLEPIRKPSGHDNIASMGTDVLLDGRGVLVSFATMEMGFLPDRFYRRVAAR